MVRRWQSGCFRSPVSYSPSRFWPAYAYLAAERPSLNVPYNVLQDNPSLQGNNSCGTNASFVNISCVPPPEPVSISWFLQAVDGIDDVNQVRGGLAGSTVIAPPDTCRVS